MKKKIRVFFEPVEISIDIDDDYEEIEAEMELTRQIYDVREDEIMNKTNISHYEEI